jgi:hypothetical protein
VHNAVRFAALVLLTLAIARSSAAPAVHWPQDAYVWQRRWTPAVGEALHRAADLISEWRVLAAETDSRGRLVPVAPEWRALRATGKPVIAVIRIDGTLEHFDQASLIAGIDRLAAAWNAQGARVAGLEIDYDCGTQHLADYAEFLKQLRKLDGIPPHLSITALPTWLGSRALDALVAIPDEVVLQVHAIRAPENGLFNANDARAWVDAFAARTETPFRVALPDYGVRTIWDSDGGLVSIVGEMPRLAGGAHAVELMAKPQDAARLLASLSLSPPQHLRGVVWFRLPTADDSRTWSEETWRAVINGEPLRADIAVTALPGAMQGVTDIVLRNPGNIDTELPRRVGLPSGCTLADGINGYALEAQQGEFFLKRLQTALLRAHREQTIGWVRCGQVQGAFDVRP